MKAKSKTRYENCDTCLYLASIIIIFHKDYRKNLEILFYYDDIT